MSERKSATSIWAEHQPDAMEKIMCAVHNAACDLFGQEDGTVSTVTVTLKSGGYHGFTVSAAQDRNDAIKTVKQ